MIKQQSINVLGIESSCDDTAIAVVQNGEKVLSNLIHSQKIHSLYGGVDPGEAAFEHVKNLEPLFHKSIEKSKLQINQIDYIAVTYSPGLVPSLHAGMSFAKGLALATKIPLIYIHHIEAHLYASIMKKNIPQTIFPALGIVLSGGHTLLVYMKRLGEYITIGKTTDDAIGEMFDKTGIALGGTYPAGHYIEKLSESFDQKKERPQIKSCKTKNPLDFSYSGIKNQIAFAISKGYDKAAIAYTLQQIVFSDVIDKILIAQNNYSFKSILCGGGVFMNKSLKKMLIETFQNMQIHIPNEELIQDNGAMIAGLAYHYKASTNRNDFSVGPKSRIDLDAIKTLLPNV